MARGEKLLDQMRANLRDWRIEDVRAVCTAHGIDLSAPTGGGSHWKVKHRAMPLILTVPARRPIKPIYIRELIPFIDGVRGAE